MLPRRQPALLVLVPLAAYLAVLLLVAALYLHPPFLGWVGFALAVLLGTGAAVLALRLFPRTEVAGERLHPRADGRLRLLVVLDATPGRGALAAAVRSRAAGRQVEVLVVAPVLATPLHFVADDVSAESRAAHDRLALALGELAAAGIPARGEVGGDDPLQAVGDALGGFPANEVVLVTRVPSGRSWLERVLERRIRDVFGLHVSLVLAREHSTAVAGRRGSLRRGAGRSS